MTSTILPPCNPLVAEPYVRLTSALYKQADYVHP